MPPEPTFFPGDSDFRRWLQANHKIDCGTKGEKNPGYDIGARQ